MLFWLACIAAAWNVACASSSPFRVPTSRKIERLKRHCNRLTALQKQIRFAPLDSFTLGDKTYKLPLKAVPPPSHIPAQQELEYLVGFFDGDGCVTMIKQRGSISLRVGQALDSASVLMRFRDSLGGGIYLERVRTGAQQASLQWVVCSTTMQHAARVLCKVPSMQRAQLQIAAAGTIIEADRSDVAQKLKQLKQNDHVPARFHCSWPYFAGFFDAEGSISVGGCAGLQLKVWQKNPFVLQELHSFLHSRELTKWRLRLMSGGGNALECTQLATCKLTLRHLLDAGLEVKQRQAALALSLTFDNHKQVRDKVLALNGLQNKNDILDDAGIERAKEIKSLYEKCRRASSQQEWELLQAKLEALREEHELEKLITKCVRLRGSIRHSLQMDGGFMLPS
ncbi:unnamed protein product [Durusdinium trenchii]|uniref:LAGLIDADG endonuclease n=1 Tax=Durusdinium trenchii TaxID=1381693 RepID=A0ABP0PSF4_9DINO